jgi:hypothetical protein
MNFTEELHAFSVNLHVVHFETSHKKLKSLQLKFAFETKL